jgi:predicted ATPase
MTNVEFRRGAAQPFVGRRAEIDALASLLTSAADGGGSAVFVVGEPGVGKSRLVEEFTGWARGGVHV